MAEALAQWRIKSKGARTYFLDLKPTRSDNTMLQITESRPKGQNQEGFEQSRVFLFSEDFEEWFKTMGEIYRHLKANPQHARPPGQRPGEKPNRGVRSDGRNGSSQGSGRGRGAAAPRERISAASGEPW